MSKKPPFNTKPSDLDLELLRSTSYSDLESLRSASDLDLESPKSAIPDDDKLYIVDIIKKLQKYKDHIFRGENQEYKIVSSTLYRRYFKNLNSQVSDSLVPSVMSLEENLVKEVKNYVEEKSNNEVSSELQHYGGNTTLIDFTYNILIALFFACNSEFQKDGRIIIFNTKGVPEKKDVSKNNTQEQQNVTEQQVEKLFLVKPTGKDPRVIFQSSVFIKAKEGYLNDNKYQCEPIESYKKKGILKALREDFDITPRTVYNDIHGFIKNKNTYPAEQELYYTGLDYFEEKNIDKAIKYYNLSIKIISKNEGNKKLNSYYVLIKNILRIKNTKIYSKSAAVYCSRGDAKSVLGKKNELENKQKKSKKSYQEAIEDYTEAIKINPQFFRAYNNRGNIKLELDDQKGAKKDYDKAIKYNPKFMNAYYNLGNLKLKLGKEEKQNTSNAQKYYDESIKYYGEAIKINPQFAEAYYNQGIVNQILKLHQKAISDFSESLKINPQFVEAYRNRGDVKSILGKNEIEDVPKAQEFYTEAIKDYDEAIKLKPQYFEAYYHRGNAKMALGDKDKQKSKEYYEGAIKDYIEVIKIKPQFAPAYSNRGNTKLALGDKAGAIEDYTEAIKINPKLSKAYYNRGVVKSSLGKHQEAIDDYTKAIEINPQYFEAYYNCGFAKLILGNKEKDKQEAKKYYERAIEDYTEAIKIKSQFFQAYYQRGVVKLNLGKYQEAIKDFNKAIKIDSKYTQAYYERGNAKANLKKYQEAIEDYTEAIKLNLQYAEAYYHRGLAQLELCNKKQEKKDEQEAIDDISKAKIIFEQQKNTEAVDRIEKLLNKLFTNNKS